MVVQRYNKVGDSNYLKLQREQEARKAAIAAGTWQGAGGRKEFISEEQDPAMFGKLVGGILGGASGLLTGGPSGIIAGAKSGVETAEKIMGVIRGNTGAVQKVKEVASMAGINTPGDVGKIAWDMYANSEANRLSPVVSFS